MGALYAYGVETDMAEDLVNWRQLHGKFQQVSDLQVPLAPRAAHVCQGQRGRDRHRDRAGHRGAESEAWNENEIGMVRQAGR